MITKPKRPTFKMFIVSDDTHAKLKQYAIKKGYKLQYVADEAVSEYLKRKTNEWLNNGSTDRDHRSQPWVDLKNETRTDTEGAETPQMNFFKNKQIINNTK
jgi:hypothetical protein